MSRVNMCFSSAGLWRRYQRAIWSISLQVRASAQQLKEIPEGHLINQPPSTYFSSASEGDTRGPSDQPASKYVLQLNSWRRYQRAIWSTSLQVRASAQQLKEIPEGHLINQPPSTCFSSTAEGDTRGPSDQPASKYVLQLNSWRRYQRAIWSTSLQVRASAQQLKEIPEGHLINQPPSTCFSSASKGDTRGPSDQPASKYVLLIPIGYRPMHTTRTQIKINKCKMVLGINDELK